MTSEKSPRVSMLIGNVRILMIGETKVKNTSKIAPMIKAIHDGFIEIPDTKYGKIKTESEITSQ